MSVPVASGGARITDRRQLVEYLAAGAKPPSDWRIGTEHEKFVFRRADLSPARYAGPDGIRALLEGLTRFGWQRVMEGDNIIGLTDGAASVSLEPGGQFELSGAPLDNLHQTCGETDQHLTQVKEVAGELGLGILAMGFQPKARRAEVDWMPKGRYAIMRDYMPKRGSLGIDMMLRTCTVQVNLDFASEADMVKKFRVGLPSPKASPTAFRASAPRSGPTPIPTAPACCRSCSSRAWGSSAMSITCSMCRCISSIATANTSTRRASPSAISWSGGCRRCGAKRRP
jgi:glutamate--cysteine ligase